MPRPLQIWIPIPGSSGTMGTYHTVFKIVLGGSWLRQALYKEILRMLDSDTSLSRANLHRKETI